MQRNWLAVDTVAAMRRQLGPTAWCALEVLLSTAHATTDGDVVVEANVRSVAETLGIAKNTAHRALRRLGDAGLVQCVQARSDSGRFACGQYHLALPVDALSPSRGQASSFPPAPAPSSARHRRRPSAAPGPVQQLVLLPEA